MMQLAQLLIRTLIALIFAAFGTIAAFAAADEGTRINYPVVAQELSAQPVNLTNMAHAPPITNVDVVATGATVAEQGKGIFMLGHETHVASLAFVVGLDAPNRAVVDTGAGSAANAARLRMQLSAEQAAGVRMPTEISGYTRHGLNHAISRDGVGVSGQAILNAFRNPSRIEYVPSSRGPSFRLTGNDAVVVVNPQGQVVTTWARNSSGVRGQ